MWKACLVSALHRWYEIQKTPTTFQKGQCGTASYTAKSPGVIGVLRQKLSISKRNLEKF